MTTDESPAISADKLVIAGLRHVRAMWRYRMFGLVVAWAVATLGAAIIMIIPKQYEGSARVFVNTDSILKPLMQGMTVQPDVGQRVALLSRVLISRPNVEKLIQATGLDENVKTQLERDKLIDKVTKKLDVAGAPSRDNIYMVTFVDTKPERAKNVVEYLVNMFIKSSKGGRTTDTEAAKQFLDEQSVVYEKKLQEAENRLKDFKLHNMVGMTPNEGRDYFAQMAAAGEQLNQAQLQLREAENSRDAFRRGLAGEDIAAAPTTATAAGESIFDLDSRLEAMKRNLDSLLQRYTEDHPDVVAARRTIREIQSQREKLLAEYRKAGVPLTQVATTGTRAAEQLKVSLAQAEASVASLRARVADYSARYNQLRDMAKRMPELEAQLAQLNRDYEINKKNYEDLIKRRESVNISEDMQSVEGVADFRIVDPPRVALKSIAAWKLLLVSIAAALGAGIGVMFLAKAVRARFFDTAQLHAVAGLPILGVVSLVGSDESRLASRKRMSSFVGTAGALLCVYVAVVATAWWLSRPVA